MTPRNAPYWSDDQVSLYLGDALEILREMPDTSVSCCVTSPPYFGLRDYGTEGQIGLEDSPAAYVERLREVFAEVRRVLAEDGTLWLNIGDSYSGSWGNQSRNENSPGMVTATDGRFPAATRTGAIRPGQPPAKNLIGMPWRLAFALQDDGWILRNDIVWHKPNAMPESVTDRLSTRHEYLFLLSKSRRYYFDLDAIREPLAFPEALERGDLVFGGRNGGEGKIGSSSARRSGRNRSVYGQGRDVPPGSDRPKNGGRGWHHDDAHPRGRNPGDVWAINTRPFPEAHFACVDAETECLTAEGWKRHDELRVGEMAAQFDVGTGHLSWGPIEAVARYEVTDQEMVVGRRRDLDMWLTPNHRCVIQRRHPRTRQLQSPLIVRADEVLPTHAVPTAALWQQEGTRPVTPDWAELLGWYIAEGHENRQGGPAVEIYQSNTANPEWVERIEKLLVSVGAEWDIARAIRMWRGRPSEQIAFRVQGFAAIRLRELSPGKAIPRDVLVWDDDLIRALLDGLIHGDGHTRKDDGRTLFVQKDRQRASMVQAMAMRLGLSATMSARGTGCYQVYLTSHQTRSFRGTAGAGAPMARALYTGTVWCPKLPEGTWVARRNGRAFITGNTFPVELPLRCIKAGTRPGGTVLDPFSGSGTTGEACRRLGRKYVGIDLNPAYHDLAIKRYAQGVMDFGEAAS